MARRVIPDANTDQLWRLDGNGTWLDFGPNGDNLSATGTVTQQAVSDMPFAYCQLIDASGSPYTDKLTAPNNREGTSFTIDGWINIAGTAGTNGHFLYESINGFAGIQLYYQTTTNEIIFFSNNGSSNFSTRFTQALTQDQWYHLAAVHDEAGTLRLYLDGALRSENSVASGAHVAGNGPYLGRRAGAESATWNVNARFADWRVSSVVRTPWELYEVFAAVRDPVAGLRP